MRNQLFLSVGLEQVLKRIFVKKTKCLCNLNHQIEWGSEMKSKTALIAGATGLVGTELVKRLLEAPEYTKIIIIVRRPTGIVHAKLEEQIIRFEELSQLDLPTRIDHVYCCLGTTMKKAKTKEAFQKVDLDYPILLAKLAKKHQAAQFLVISSMGANAQSPVFYSKTKGQLEDQLKQMGLKGLKIFRPSLLLGERNEFRLAEATTAKLSKSLPFLFIGKMKKYKPVQAATVARAMIAIALLDQSGTHVYESQHIAYYCEFE